MGGIETRKRGRRRGAGARRALWVGGLSAASVVVGLLVAGGLANALLGSGYGPADPKYVCKADPALTLKVAGPPMSMGPRLVLAIKWTVVNDEDSGFAGYWGLDSYTSHVWVWSLRAGPAGEAFFWMHTYSGMFQVPQGALSPGETGATPNAVAQPTPGYGTFAGGDWGYISSNESFLVTNSLPVVANLGVKNYGGTTADVLLGTYGAGQVGDATPYSWYTSYFTPADPGYAQFSYGLSGNAWGFVYTLNHAFTTLPNGGSTSANQWCNFGAGAFGDIVTSG